MRERIIIAQPAGAKCVRAFSSRSCRQGNAHMHFLPDSVGKSMRKKISLTTYFISQDRAIKITFNCKFTSL
jgi:hypothetical protein